MNNKISNVSFRIDTDVKNQAERLFAELGLNMTTAFNIFLRQSIREGAIPFNITTSTPTNTVIAAMLEDGALFMKGVYSRLAESETDVAAGRKSNAKKSLERIRGKHNV